MDSLDTKTCAICGAEMLRRIDVHPRHFARRQTCSVMCTGALHKKQSRAYAATKRRLGDPDPELGLMDPRTRQIARRKEIERRIAEKARDEARRPLQCALPESARSGIQHA